MILGTGLDVVEISAFAEQLAVPGSRFAEVFTAQERRAARTRATARAGEGQELDPVPHLAARWAAKEAFIKAFASARYGQPPVLAEGEWAAIEVIQDQWGRPALRLHDPFRSAVAETLGEVRMHVSVSHDGPIAAAQVILESP